MADELCKYCGKVFEEHITEKGFGERYCGNSDTSDLFKPSGWYAGQPNRPGMYALEVQPHGADAYTSVEDIDEDDPANLDWCCVIHYFPIPDSPPIPKQEVKG